MKPISFFCALLSCLWCGTPVAAASGGWTWPVRGPVITSYRNGSDPYAGGQHRGIDIGAPVGARVVAAAGGTVTFAGVVGASGLVVSERTADGRFDVSYLHLSSASVRRGETLPEGSLVGAVGESGSARSVEAPHLHFGVREAGSRSAYRDPLEFLSPPPGGGGDPEPVPAPVRVEVPAEGAPAAAASPATVPGLAPAPGLVPAPVWAGVSGAPAAHGLSTNRYLARAESPARGPEDLRPRSLPSTEPSAATRAPGPRANAHPRPHQSAQPAADRAPATGNAGKPTTSHHRPTHAHHAHGIDLGWLLACLGLIAAATALARPDGTRHATARTRATVGALLRPKPHRS